MALTLLPFLAAAFRPAISMKATASPAAMEVSQTSQLAQLASMTTLSIDTGDLDVIEKFASTGLITDATTNPLFVSQAGLSGDARYIAFVDRAIDYARANAGGGDDAVLELAMDRLEPGLEIVKLVPLRFHGGRYPRLVRRCGVAPPRASHH